MMCQHLVIQCPFNSVFHATIKLSQLSFKKLKSFMLINFRFEDLQIQIVSGRCKIVTNSSKRISSCVYFIVILFFYSLCFNLFLSLSLSYSPYLYIYISSNIALTAYHDIQLSLSSSFLSLSHFFFIFVLTLLPPLVKI